MRKTAAVVPYPWVVEDQLTDDDRRMLADLNAEARRIQAKKLLQWTLILVPGIPLVIASIFFMGIFVGGAMGVGATVGWALVVQKLIPVRELI